MKTKFIRNIVKLALFLFLFLIDLPVFGQVLPFPPRISPPKSRKPILRLPKIIVRPDVRELNGQKLEQVFQDYIFIDKTFFYDLQISSKNANLFEIEFATDGVKLEIKLISSDGKEIELDTDSFQYLVKTKPINYNNRLSYKLAIKAVKGGMPRGNFVFRVFSKRIIKDINLNPLSIFKDLESDLKAYKNKNLNVPINDALEKYSKGYYDATFKELNEILLHTPRYNYENRATLYNAFGAIYSNLGSFSKARTFYQKGLQMCLYAKSPQCESITLSNLGSIYSEFKQYDKAAIYFEKSIKIKKKLKDLYGLANTLNYYGLMFREQKLYDKAINKHSESLNLARQIGNKLLEADSIEELGRDELAQNHFELAVKKFDEAISIYRSIGDSYGESETLADLMKAWKSIGDNSLAIFYGKQAINFYQTTRLNIKSFERKDQSNFLKTKEIIYRKLAEILIIEGRFPEAQAVLDLLKEEEFKQIVRRSGEPLFTLPYSRAEEETIKIVDRLASLGRELSELKAKPKDSLTEVETKRLSEIESIEIPAANKALRQATEALSKVAPDVKNALDLKMKDNIQTILPAFGKGVVALYTVIGKTAADIANNKNINNKINIGWILLVTPEFRKAYPIDTTDLEQTVFKLRQTLRSPQYDPQPVAQELYKKLFLQTSPKQTKTLEQDLQEYLGQHKDKTLMWSLDGVLRYVPMAALHDGKGYLVEKYRNTVFNTASLGSLKDSVKPNWEIVGLGVSTEGTVKASDGRMLRFSALKGSATELNSIVKENNGRDTEGIFPGTLKINNDFTKEALFEGARTGKPVIHISSHFWFNQAKEETSFLLLGNGNRLEVTEFQDYPNLFSTVDFLSLSACDTATGGNANNSTNASTTETGKGLIEENARASNGKEIEGFAYIAQTLGAKSVMASLWQVSDEGTKELMLKFYQIKKEQPEMPKGEALRQAQLSLLNGTLTSKAETTEGTEIQQQGLVRETSSQALKPFVKDSTKPFAHPYYWSPFVLIGNWR